MLVVNNEPLNLLNPQTPLEKSVKDTLEVIRKKRDLVVIRSNKPIQFSDRGRKLPIQDVVIEMKETKAGEGGETQHWVYCSSPKINNGEPVYIRDHFRVVNGMTQLTPKKDTEKIYFLQEVCNIRSWGLKIEDLEADAMKSLEKDQKESTLKYYITSPQSPLSEKDIRVLAASWGVQKTDVTGINHIKIQLRDKVLASEKNIKSTNRGIDDFLKDASEMGIDTEVRANVNLAVEKKIIVNVEQAREWRYFKPDGVLITKYSAMRSDRKNDVLYQYFLAHKEDYAELVAELGGDQEIPRRTFEEIKKIQRVNEIRQALKDDYKITLPIGLSRDDILKEAERRLGIG